MSGLKPLINSYNKNSVDKFWSSFINHTDRTTVFENFVYVYLKATLPGHTYWLHEDVVPNDIAFEMNFNHILKGKRTEGCDIVNVSPNGSVTAYEVKWIDPKHKNYTDVKALSQSLTANKKVVIDTTDIESLVMCSNAPVVSDNVVAYMPDVGFMGQDVWFSEDAFDIVKQFVNTTSKKKYQQLFPRDKFFEQVIDDLGVKFNKHNKTKGFSSVEEYIHRIFMHWPAATGKGSLPRLAYDAIYEKSWDYKIGYPINLVLSPNIQVLTTNLTKVTEHDMALGSNARHVIFAGDPRRSAADSRSYQILKQTCLVFSDKIKFIEFIKKEHNETLWIHCTCQGYENLASIMKQANKKFFFAHMDEVHHNSQNEWSKWSYPLNDDILKIQIRLMTSANVRVINERLGKPARFSMEHPDFCDYQTLPLSEKEAYKRGYKRYTRILLTAYDQASFPEDMVEMFFDKNKEPYVRVNGSAPVKLSWFMAADALVRFKIFDNPKYKHTLLTLNSKQNCRDFAKFFGDVLEPLLIHYKVDRETFARLKKAKIYVADLDNKNNSLITKELQNIPKTCNDSFIIQCYMLGEGWDPVDGFIDSSMFIDPTWSELRIYQTINRGTRNGNGIDTHIVLVVGFADTIAEGSSFNQMFDPVRRVANALEIGVEDIKDLLDFVIARPTPNGSRTTAGKSNTPNSDYDVDVAWLAEKCYGYLESGKYIPFGDSTNAILTDWMNAHDKYGLWLTGNAGIGQLVMESIIIKYWDFLSQFANPKDRFRTIVKGNDFRLSTQKQFEVVEFNDKKLFEYNERMKFLKKNIKLLESENSDDVKKLIGMYAKSFPSENLDVSEMIGHEDKFKKGKGYSYKRDKDFTLVTYINDGYFIDKVKEYEVIKDIKPISKQINKSQKKRGFLSRLLRRVA